MQIYTAHSLDLRTALLKSIFTYFTEDSSSRKKAKLAPTDDASDKGKQKATVEDDQQGDDEDDRDDGVDNGDGDWDGDWDGDGDGEEGGEGKRKKGIEISAKPLNVRVRPWVVKVLTRFLELEKIYGYEQARLLCLHRMDKVASPFSLGI